MENYNLLQDHCNNDVYDKEPIINIRLVAALDSFDAYVMPMIPIFIYTVLLYAYN